MFSLFNYLSVNIDITEWFLVPYIFVLFFLFYLFLPLRLPCFCLRELSGQRGRKAPLNASQLMTFLSCLWPLSVVCCTLGGEEGRRADGGCVCSRVVAADLLFGSWPHFFFTYHRYHSSKGKRHCLSLLLTRWHFSLSTMLLTHAPLSRPQFVIYQRITRQPIL